MGTDTLRIVKPLYGGFGLGFGHGKAVFVPNGVPGEEYAIRITNEGTDYDTAEIVDVITASPDRIAPECPNFNLCGGCSYLHVSYELELSMKKDIIADCLKRIAGIREECMPAIPVISAKRFGYRSHASVKMRDGKAGFFKKDSNELVSFPEPGCLLLAPEINIRLKSEPLPEEDFTAALDADGSCVATDNDDCEITERESGIEFRRSIGDFYQANRFLRPEMIETVLRSVPPALDSFMDIYCGIGFFTLHVARRARCGVGYDIQKKTIRYAQSNAALNGIQNAVFHALPASQIRTTKQRPELIIIDPPRAGADKKTRRTIGELAPRRIIYVSCNPATFARDIRDFCKNGYALREVTLIDMFPGTVHMEIEGILDRQ